MVFAARALQSLRSSNRCATGARRPKICRTTRRIPARRLIRRSVLGRACSPIGGDTIVAQIGAGAQGIAVGKHIQQQIGAGAAADLDADRHAIEALLARLERDLSNAAGRIDGAASTMAAFQLRLLAGELSKIGARATPSASTISQVGDWLADNVPPLHDALAALFTAPAVLRVLRQADTPLDAWLQRRFGV